MSALTQGAALCDGRYRLDEVIGRGGMSIVWRATDMQLERPVAIKVISDVLATDPRFVARFEREARLAAALNHPNLVKVFDFSVDEERPFLIMEYVAGGTLADKRGQAVETESLARALLDALAHIHAAGILHRDIKPANVLLAGDSSPRLTDFGIARGDDQTGLTQTGQVLGTLRYIAPEVAEGRPATPQSDLYSLGVLLGEIAGANASAGLATLIARMQAPAPEQRPASAAEALAELDPTATLPPTAPLAADTDATQRLGKEAQTPIRAARRAGFGFAGLALKRTHAIAAAALLVVVLLIVVVAGSGGGSSGTKAKPAQLKPAPQSAPADAQITQLEKIVRAAPGR